MATADSYAEDLLRHVFLNETLALIGDATGLLPSAIAGNIYISLHTSDPGVHGSQTTNEVTLAAWPSYARQPIARSGAGWQVVELLNIWQAKNLVSVTFPARVGGSIVTVTHGGIGASLSGTGLLMHPFPLTTPVTILESPFQFTFEVNELVIQQR